MSVDPAHIQVNIGCTPTQTLEVMLNIFKCIIEAQLRPATAAQTELKFNVGQLEPEAAPHQHAWC
eukprot:10475062-Alexandrium_andersonii.AAC.1